MPSSLLSLKFSKMAVSRLLGLAYGSMALFLSILHNVFLLYYVDIFVSVYKIDKQSFWIGETIFLLWNSFNDPLFGWMSDKKFLSPNSCKDITTTEVIKQRLRALSVHGPLFTLSFMSFWFLWTYPGLQFTVCLCVYDGLLTMVDLHHSALLADLALSAKDRTKLNFYSSVFGALGALSVFFSYAVWDKGDLDNFRMFCVMLTVFSFCGFFFSSRFLLKIFSEIHKKDDHFQSSSSDMSGYADNQPEVSLKVYVKQLRKHSNFQWFAAMNLVQVFHCHFNSNFFPLFLEHLLGEQLSSSTASLLLGASFMAPHINNLYFLSLCRKYGVYTVIQYLFYIKFSLSLFMFFIGPNYVVFLCLFIASNRIFTEGTCKLLNLVISDLVDEDCVIHGRKQAVSALMFGTTALLSKPGQTLAPLFGVSLLAFETGYDIFASDHGGALKINNAASENEDLLRSGCFNCLVYIPLLCALLQIVLWSKFTLHGKRLNWVKDVRSGAAWYTV
ncbi:transmembrane protein 180-like [Anneissia japonica]|uniref:transmembrane protein 180-like n=1 Tax=Anneissia japonica TaxID=1529436 RepID=UPI0014257440|nr:transmembrane protein 180-like [Anneissia japonica]